MGLQEDLRNAQQRELKDTENFFNENQMALIKAAKRLLQASREKQFTFRAVDFLYDIKLFISTILTPCATHTQNITDLGMGDAVMHSVYFSLSCCFIGSLYSTGLSKAMYRKKNRIPGLYTDDLFLGCICPWCIAIQLRNELNEQQVEKKQLERVTAFLLNSQQQQNQNEMRMQRI